MVLSVEDMAIPLASWRPSFIEDISLFVTSYELEHGLLFGIRAISIAGDHLIVITVK